MEPQDTITIAPAVLITIASHAATGVSGVANVAPVPVNAARLLRGNPMGSGVVIELDDQKVGIDLYLIVNPDVSMKDISREVQQAVKRSIEELVGMEVTRVNVHIEDVAYTNPALRREA